MSTPEILTTRVGIVGGGPAGLMLSHLLAKAGIDSIVVEKRDHETIRTTHRAGILEHGSVSMLVDSGVSDRVLREGHRHEGIDLRFGKYGLRYARQDESKRSNPFHRGNSPRDSETVRTYCATPDMLAPGE